MGRYKKQLFNSIYQLLAIKKEHPEYLEQAENFLMIPDEKGVKFAEDYQAQSEVVDKWNEYMQDVMVMEMDPETGAQPKMQQVFFLE